MAMLAFVSYKLMKSTVWTTLALLTKASFGPHLVGRVWPLLTTSSRAVRFHYCHSFCRLSAHSLSCSCPPLFCFAQGAVLGGLLLSPLGAYGWNAPILVVAVSLVALSVVLWVQIGLPSSAGSTPETDDKSRGGGMQQSLAAVAADSQLCLLFVAQAMCLPVR
jgi:hypothetical protein